MGWKVIKTEDEYNIASTRLMDIFNAEQGTAEGDELELLIVLIKDFDDKHYIIPQPDPIVAIKYRMQERGLKAKDLEPYIGSKGYVSAILSGKRELTLKMAQRLKNYLQLAPEIFLPI